MGLFSRRRDPDRELATAIAKRGGRARGRIVAVAEEGDRLAVGVRFAPEGGAEREVTVRQRFAPQSRVGLEAGEPVELSYDRDDPGAVLIWGNPRFRVDEQGFVVRVVDVAGGERG